MNIEIIKDMNLLENAIMDQMIPQLVEVIDKAICKATKKEFKAITDKKVSVDDLVDRLNKLQKKTQSFKQLLIKATVVVDLVWGDEGGISKYYNNSFKPDAQYLATLNFIHMLLLEVWEIDLQIDHISWFLNKPRIYNSVTKDDLVTLIKASDCDRLISEMLDMVAYDTAKCEKELNEEERSKFRALGYWIE